MIIAEEISSPIKSSFYDVPSIILNYSVFALETIIAAQSPLHCHFASRDSIELSNTASMCIIIIIRRWCIMHDIWWHHKWLIYSNSIFDINSSGY